MKRLEAVESAEGTAPSAAHRTRREPLDSPGSCCSNHKLPAPTPVGKKRWPSTFLSTQPCPCSELVPAKALVLPHGPTNQQRIDVFRHGLEFRTPKSAVIRHPATQSRGCPRSQILHRKVTATEDPTVSERLAHRLHGRTADRRGKPRTDLALTDHPPGAKRVAKKVELDDRVPPRSVTVLAIHHLRFRRVKLQAALLKPGFEMRSHRKSLGLTTAMKHPIISVAAELDLRMMASQPVIQRVMEEQIR